MFRYILLVLLAFTLAGCESWQASARINPQTVAIYPGGKGKNASDFATQECPLTSGLDDTEQGAIDLDCFRFPERGRDGGEAFFTGNERRYAYDLATQNDANGVLARNRLSAILVKHADDICVLEKGRLVATEASVNGALSFLTSAFSGTSTIVGGEQAKSILSGIASLTNATQANVNATFYRNQLTQAINKAIDKERERVMVEIVASRGKAMDAYTVDEMIRQVNAYHHACSFERGLQVLLDAALDTTGANAVLEARSRSRAIAELETHLRFLDAQLKADSSNAELKKKRDEVLAELHGLRMASVRKKVIDPTAGEEAAEIEEESGGTEGEIGSQEGEGDG